MSSEKIKIGASRPSNSAHVVRFSEARPTHALRTAIRQGTSTDGAASDVSPFAACQLLVNGIFQLLPTAVDVRHIVTTAHATTELKIQIQTTVLGFHVPQILRVALHGG